MVGVCPEWSSASAAGLQRHRGTCGVRVGIKISASPAFFLGLLFRCATEIHGHDKNGSKDPSDGWFGYTVGKEATRKEK